MEDDENSDSENQSDQEYNQEHEEELKQKLSEVPYETLLKVKKAITKKSKAEQKIVALKGKPIERNAKLPVPPKTTLNINPVNQKRISRDPRFQECSGDLNKTMFRKAYSFMSNERNQKITEIQKAMKKKGLDFQEKRKMQSEIMKLKDAQCKYDMEESESSIRKSMGSYHIKKTDRKYLNKVSKLKKLHDTNQLEGYIQKTMVDKEKKVSKF